MRAVCTSMGSFQYLGRVLPVMSRFVVYTSENSQVLNKRSIQGLELFKANFVSICYIDRLGKWCRYWDPYYYRRSRSVKRSGGMNFFESVGGWCLKICFVHFFWSSGEKCVLLLLPLLFSSKTARVWACSILFSCYWEGDMGFCCHLYLPTVQVFSFVFGDGDPNEGLEDLRWKSVRLLTLLLRVKW